MALIIKLVRNFWWVLILAGLAILLAVGFVLTILPPRPAMIFRRVVLSPIPTSVRQIRADHKSGIDEYSYILRFAISPEDLALLVRSRPYEELAFVEYDEGDLAYGNTEFSSTRIQLYAVYDGEREPEWFDLSKWRRCRVYVAEEEDPNLYNVRLLLYNESRSEAYLIEHEIRGHWDFDPPGIGKEYRKAQEQQEREMKEGIHREVKEQYPKFKEQEASGKQE